MKILKDIRSILIRSTNWVGDAVMTTPAVRAVRRNFPGARIVVLAKPWVAPVFWNNPYVDEVQIYESTGGHLGWAGKLGLARVLRKQQYELAVLFQNAFEAAVLAFLAGIPNRLGYDTDGRRVLLTHPISVMPWLKKVHEIDYYLGILEGVGLEGAGRELVLALTAQERARAAEFLASHGISRDLPVVGICPGATYGSAKRWSPQRYGLLSARIARAFGARVVIFGGPAEEAAARGVCEAMEAPCLNLCGKTTLREAAALIAQCDLFVTNDSGLMHVAAALGVPVVAVFGSTNPMTTGPSGPRTYVVRLPASCSPCLLEDCPKDHRCMERVTVDMVYEAVERGLESVTVKR